MKDFSAICKSNCSTIDQSILISFTLFYRDEGKFPRHTLELAVLVQKLKCQKNIKILFNLSPLTLTLRLQKKYAIEPYFVAQNSGT